MRRLFATAGIVAAGFGFATFGASPARADENGYIADLQAAGVPMLAGPAASIGGGYQACDAIRGGMSPATAATQWGLLSQQWGSAIVDAAQRNLCPDTLR